MSELRSFQRPNLEQLFQFTKKELDYDELLRVAGAHIMLL